MIFQAEKSEQNIGSDALTYSTINILNFLLLIVESICIKV